MEQVLTRRARTTLGRAAGAIAVVALATALTYKQQSSARRHRRRSRYRLLRRALQTRAIRKPKRTGSLTFLPRSRSSLERLG